MNNDNNDTNENLFTKRAFFERPFLRRTKRTAIGASVAALVLAGCAAGPDYRQPEAPAVKNYITDALPAETAGAPGTGGSVQRFDPGKEIPAQWWTLFRSEQLDRVIREALEHNPTLAAAQATLVQSQENLRAVVGSALFPSVNANASGARQQISGAAFGQPNNHFSPFTLFNASVQVSYALDLAGGARREREALRSQVDFQQFQLEGAYLTIAANIVTTAVKEASLRAQIRSVQEIIASEEKQLEVVERQFALGAVPRTDVLAQRAQVGQTRTQLPQLEKALFQTRHQLSVLTNTLPGDSAALPIFELDALQLPQDLPVSLPSALVRQRPDVRASESLLHAASARIGVATANMLPQLNLTGSYGSEAIRTGALFAAGSSVWSLGAGLTQPLFHGGELTARKRAAEAAYDQAAAEYRTAVLQAFQNVADVLRALDADARTLKAQSDATTAAEESFELTQKQFSLGAVSYLSILNAQRQYQQARIGLVQAQATRYADTAALFQALGGGWWNRGADKDKTAAMVSSEEKAP
jgi:NodT family efflux transporter outer membrane factor (OMF) lipoprotein